MLEGKGMMGQGDTADWGRDFGHTILHPCWIQGCFQFLLLNRRVSCLFSLFILFDRAKVLFSAGIWGCCEGPGAAGRWNDAAFPGKPVCVWMGAGSQMRRTLTANDF